MSNTLTVETLSRVLNEMVMGPLTGLGEIAMPKEEAPAYFSAILPGFMLIAGMVNVHGIWLFWASIRLTLLIAAVYCSTPSVLLVVPNMENAFPLKFIDPIPRCTEATIILPFVFSIL